MKIPKKIAIGLFGILMLSAYTNCAQTSSTAPSNGGNSPQSIACFDQLGTNTEWSREQEVPIDGYSANSMEPQVSADQVTLFFNNKTATDTEMNVHYAVKQSNGRYLYIGTLPGTVDNSSLDGVPSVDIYGNFYFISLRNYGSTLRTLFSGQINVVGANSLSVTNVAEADAQVGRNTLWLLDMDMAVSWDGTLALSSRSDFSSHLSYPDASFLDMFTVSNRTLSKINNSLDLLKNVNLPGCRIYAPSLSPDNKELYYTILEVKNGNEYKFGILVAKRSTVNEPFGKGALITAITGDITEAPSITYNDGGKTLFYHKKDSVSGNFKIYKVTRN